MADTNTENPEILALAELDTLIHAPARLMVMTYLYVVESVDYVFLKRLTKLSWGNLSMHLTKLEEGGYVEMEKTFDGKKPKTMIWLTDSGRNAFRKYKNGMQDVLGNLPEK